MSLETDIRDYLATQLLGVFETTLPNTYAIHIGKMPSTPDRIVLITQSTGLPPNPKYLLDYPNVQIRVRGPQGNYENARARAKDIKDALLGIASVTQPSGDRWVAINMLSDIAFLGFDATERPEFSLNFAFIVEPAVPASSHRIPI